MAQRAASYGTAVLHKSLTMKHCFAKAPQYETSPFHSDMKHFAYAPYDVRKWKMRVYPFAIQRYPHYIMTCNPVLSDRIFLCLDFTHRISSIYSNIIAPTENKHPAFEPQGDTIVKAELIEVPIEDWPNVDRLEGYPRLYDRQLFPAKLADGTEVSGWVYIMNELPPDAEIIEGGDWKAHNG